MNCPCQGCTKRWVSETSRCHSSCKEYKEWYELTQQQKGLLAKRKAVFRSIKDVQFGHWKKFY